MTFRIDLGAGFSKLGEAPGGRFIGASRYLSTGEWQLDVGPAGLDLNPDSLEDVDTVTVTDEDVDRIVFAGFMRRPSGYEAGLLTKVDAEQTALEFRGIDLWGIMGLRVVYPNPAQRPPWDTAYDTRSDVGSTAAAGYIADNLGSTALPERQYADLTIVDPVVGDSSTWDGRLQPLSQLVGRICRDSGISLHVTMPTPGALRFEFGSPKTRDAILLSSLGDLEELEQLVTPASATYVIVAGQGEGTDRAFRTADTGSAGLDRVENVYENTNILTSAGLLTAATTELALSATDTSVSATPTMASAQRLRYLTDYRLGDFLNVEVDGVRRQAQVEGVQFDISAERAVVSPLLGRTSTNDYTNLIRDVAGLAARFDTQIA